MSHVGRHHVHLAGLMKSIQNEQGVNEVLMKQLDSGRKDVIPKKRKKYENYDKRLKNIVELYDRDNVNKYLCNISSNIML